MKRINSALLGLGLLLLAENNGKGLLNSEAAVSGKEPRVLSVGSEDDAFTNLLQENEDARNPRLARRQLQKLRMLRLWQERRTDDEEDDPQNQRVLFIPSYANQTMVNDTNGQPQTVWNVRLYGLLYTDDNADNTSTSIVSKIIDKATSFINDTVVQQLTDAAVTPEEKANLTANLRAFTSWKYLDEKNINFTIIGATENNQRQQPPTPPALSSPSPSSRMRYLQGLPGGSSAVNISTAEETQNDGRFDEFVTLPQSLSSIQPNSILNITFAPASANSSNPANVSDAFYGNVTLVPETGISIISDVDDVVRITKIWEPLNGLINTFVKAYVPVEGMPETFWQWKTNVTNVTFHYATTTPIPLAAPYIRWLGMVYPYGSLDFRPLDISKPDDILQARQDMVDRLFETFPNRKFVMIGDTSNEDVIKAYTVAAGKWPNQTACIFVRNITATYPDFSNPLVNLQKSFADIPRDKWFVYDNSSTLRRIDVSGGKCQPDGIETNQTTESGGYGGTGNDSGNSTSSGSQSGNQSSAAGILRVSNLEVMISVAVMLAATVFGFC